MILRGMTMVRDELDGETGGAAGGGGATSTEPQVTPAEFEGEAGAGDEPAPYVPNHKFKVLDQEKDMDEWLKPLVKDAETESKARELLEKAYGLDHVKASRQQIQSAYEGLGQQHQRLVGQINDLSAMVQKDDMESFFEALQIPEDKILKYALTRIQYREAAPEQRAAYDQWRATQAQVRTLEQQNGQYQSTLQQTSTQTRTRELDIAAARPEVAQVAQAYDTRVGKPGAFKEEVINRGRFHWAVNQKDIGVDDAIKEVLALIGGSPQATQIPGQNLPAPAGQPGTPMQASQVVPRAPEKKPVIPNFSGNGTSPAKVVPRSIKQLREIGAAMASAER